MQNDRVKIRLKMGAGGELLFMYIWNDYYSAEQLELSKIRHGVRVRGAMYRMNWRKSKKRKKEWIKSIKSCCQFHSSLYYFTPLTLHTIPINWRCYHTLFRRFGVIDSNAPFFSPSPPFASFARFNFLIFVHDHIIPLACGGCSAGGLAFDSTRMHALSSYLTRWSKICRYLGTRCFLNFRISIIDMKILITREKMPDDRWCYLLKLRVVLMPMWWVSCSW